MSSFQLSDTLEGHSQDVRSLCVPSSSTILSSSRDATAIVWKAGTGKEKAWLQSRSIPDPDGKFVSSVGWLEAGDTSYVVLGSQSSLITLWDISDETATKPSFTLLGHKLNVCCLDSNASGYLISGSWDKTAVIWKDMKIVTTLSKHQQAVWAVQCVGQDRFLTGSADKSINLHSVTGSLLRTFTGHTDCVRSLSMRTDGAGEEGFWSAGNDGNVMLWSLKDTSPVGIYSGHTSFVYAVAALPDGNSAVSSGEDGTVRVWEGGVEVQTITHPTISVWTVSVLPNGDVVSGASDGMVRVWTKDEFRRASREQIELFSKSVAARQINKSQIGDVNKTDLPGTEALSKPGKKEGQVVMIKNGDAVEAYQWESNARTWQQIGQVVDAIGSGRKQLYDGQEYDYVFDVDISEGMPPLKLPYNVTENPWAAAQKFLYKHELPPSYADQVVAFIEQSTKGAQLGGGAAYKDPFTGGSSYTTGTGVSTNSASYRDPYTGGGAYSSTPAVSSTKAKVLPVKTPQYYQQLNVPAVKKKIAELNEAMKAEAMTNDAAMTIEEQRNLDEILAQLSSPAVSRPNVDASKAAERYEPALLLSVLQKWPEERRFPVLDVFRVLVGSSPAMGATDHLIDSILAACAWSSGWEPSKTRETNTMIAMRAIANLTATANGRTKVEAENVGELLEHLASHHQFERFNKNTRTAMATIALNFSISTVNGQFPVSQAAKLLQYISNILANESEDGEVAYRTIVALGNIVRSPSLSGALSVGDVQLAKELASGLADKIGEARCKDVVAEIDTV